MQPLILLHGAIGSSSQLAGLAQKLSSNFDVHNLDLPGHGGRPMPAEFSIPFFAEYVKNYCDERGLENVLIFGYSMGGYVGMFLAKKHPQLVQKLATLATKFYWDETIAAKEVKMLQPEVIRQKLPDFAKTLEQRHASLNWEEVLAGTAAMLTAMGKDNVLKPGEYSEISQPCLIMLGDRDKMVGLDETFSVYNSIPNGQLAVMPSTKHPVENVNVETVAYLAGKFFKDF